MTDADKYFLQFKNDFFWTIFSTGFGTHLKSRAVALQHNEPSGFFMITKSGTRKLQEVAKNPHVTLAVWKKGDYNTVVAHCSARVSDKPEDFQAVWSDSFINYGYTGKTDERGRVIFFTIHSVVHGTKVIAGTPQDPKTFVIDATDPLPPLPEGPYQSAEAKELVKKTIGTHTNWHLITRNSLHIEDRVMQTDYHDELGIWQVTGASSKKVKEINANPNVSLLFPNYETFDQVVVDAVCWVDKTLETKEKVYFAGMKQYGYNSANDPGWVVLRFAIRSVEHHKAASAPTVYVCEPPKYDQDCQILYKAAKLDGILYLMTVDEKHVPHARIMGGIFFHPALGFFCSTRHTDKADQIEANPHAVIVRHDEKTTDDYIIEVFCTMQNSVMTNYATWTEIMKSVGYTGPEDDRMWKITLCPTDAKCQNVGQFWASISGASA